MLRLRTKSLLDDERVNFYALGGGKALLLDAAHPGWPQRYLSTPLDLSAYF